MQALRGTAAESLLLEIIQRHADNRLLKLLGLTGQRGGGFFESSLAKCECFA